MKVSIFIFFWKTEALEQRLKSVGKTWPMDRLSVLLFSELSKICFGYFDPENMFVENEYKWFSRWPNRGFRLKQNHCWSGHPQNLLWLHKNIYQVSKVSKYPIKAWFTFEIVFTACNADMNQFGLKRLFTSTERQRTELWVGNLRTCFRTAVMAKWSQLRTVAKTQTLVGSVGGRDVSMFISRLHGMNPHVTG